MASKLFKDLFVRSESKKERRIKQRNNVENRTILIIDDSRTVVHALKSMLEPAGYITIAAADGTRGIELAIEQRPSLILMDIVMPGINGFKATRLLRKEPRTEHVPIVIMSGNEQATERFWGMRLGANDFLSKPISRGDLFGTLEDMLANTGVQKNSGSQAEYDLLYD